MVNRAIHTLAIVAAMAFGLCHAQGQNTGLYDWSTGGTLRIDCLRHGSAKADSVWVVRYTDRHNAWHGSATKLIDPFDNGDYRVVVRLPHNGTVLYSRCYSNLFREYKDTPEGCTQSATFEEVLLVPMPRVVVEVVLQHRDSNMRFIDQHVSTFTPGATPVEPTAQAARVWPIELHGHSQDKIDVVIVAQGYDTTSAEVLQRDFRRMTEILFGQEPFNSHRTDFNIRGVAGNAGAKFGTLGIDRYLMTTHIFDMHNIIGSTPADYIIVMVNSTVYGGGALYNNYAVSTMHSMAEYVLPHEFGHCFGGLADEYTDEDLSYANLHRTRYEPVEPNITNLVDFGSKWQHLIADGTPLPTPPDNNVPRNQCGPVGLYEGAGYSATGVYRPTMRCMMRDYAPFCPVCSNRIEDIFKLYTR